MGNIVCNNQGRKRVGTTTGASSQAIPEEYEEEEEEESDQNLEIPQDVVNELRTAVDRLEAAEDDPGKDGMAQAV